MDATQELDMFRPPICRGMRSLDRSFFQKEVSLKAARIFDNKNISRIRNELHRSKDSLEQDRIANVRTDPQLDRAKAGQKCIVLRPELRFHDEAASQSNGTSTQHLEGVNGPATPWPHSSILSDLVEQKLISVIPYQLSLDYSYWTYHDIIASILPEDEQGEIPSGFSQVGHVAHLNLREAYLPYKHLIAEIILDKNSGVRTVINKIDDVGEENEFRTFRYEVLAGPDDMNVEVSEENCLFRFDYSKVYWNTRLQTEHRRLVSLFKEGEAVCDLMAGVGPFAVPAGKRKVFVWANDLNPDSFECLQDAVSRNKVGQYVHAFNEDGRKFVRSAVAQLLDTDHQVQVKARTSRTDGQSTRHESKAPEIIKTSTQPKTFQHFVLNLPASALTFLSSFVGLYPTALRSRLPNDALMPIIHVYCFSTKDELEEAASTADTKICAEISSQLKFEMKSGKLEDGDVEIFDVRDVAPKKRMFCASFRLPTEVAFADP